MTNELNRIRSALVYNTVTDKFLLDYRNNDVWGERYHIADKMAIPLNDELNIDYFYFAAYYNQDCKRFLKIIDNISSIILVPIDIEGKLYWDDVIFHCDIKSSFMG